MGKKQTRLHLSRETVRELDAELKAAVGGQPAAANPSLPPTFCGCTGTETYTNICCIIG